MLPEKYGSLNNLQGCADSQGREQPGTDPQLPADLEHPISVTREAHSPSQPGEGVQCEQMQGLKVKAHILADRLAVHEQTHWGISKNLEREERKLGERRKSDGGNTLKRKKII